MNELKSLLLFLLLTIGTGLSQTDIYDSGGPLMPEQASYDVRYYDLSLTVNPSDSSIDGSLQIKADIVQPIDHFVLDLDTLLAIHKIFEIDKIGAELPKTFHRNIGKVRIYLHRTRQPGESIRLRIYYGGKPRIALRPPWDGGFTWAKTWDGSPWIATTCEGEGADIWFPCKDYISDEPDSMGIHVRVPQPLFCASNGRLRSIEKHDDHTRTFHWFVSTPINNYGVALNIAPYKLIEDTYQSVAGDRFPVKFWVLPEDYEKGKEFFPKFIEYLRYFEKTLGPFPFRADKCSIVQTPYLGMEHQTIIAYGANFDNSAMVGRDWGFDALLHHELSHEWWGNMVTCQDWRDLWLHEGFGTYMQALYIEETQGFAVYQKYMQSFHNFSSDLAVAPRSSQTANQIYQAPIYSKGAWALHTLRYLIGKEAMMTALRHMAYPDPALEKITDGRQTRFATTDDFLQIAEQASGKKLDWFFEVYLRQAKLPQLITDIQENNLTLSWKTPDSLAFPMPIDLKFNDEIRRVEIPEGGITLKLKSGKLPHIDPQHWGLFELEDLILGEAFIDNGNYQKAKSSFDKVIQFEPENKIAQRLIGHITYAQKNVDKLSSDFFNRYVGKYQSNSGFTQIVTEESNSLFLENRMFGKFRIYPVAENKFIVKNFDITFTFITDDEGHAKELASESDFMTRHYVRIE